MLEEDDGYEGLAASSVGDRNDVALDSSVGDLLLVRARVVASCCHEKVKGVLDAV